MIKRELAKDPKLANEDWSRFLPKFGKRKEKRPATNNGNQFEANSHSAGWQPNGAADGGEDSLQQRSSEFGKAKKAKPIVKKPYTPFPPAQQPSKVRSGTANFGAPSADVAFVFTDRSAIGIRRVLPQAEGEEGKDNRRQECQGLRLNYSRLQLADYVEFAQQHMLAANQRQEKRAEAFVAPTEGGTAENGEQPAKKKKKSKRPKAVDAAEA